MKKGISYLLLVILHINGLALSAYARQKPVEAQKRNFSYTESRRANLFIDEPKFIATFETISVEFPFKGDANQNSYCDVRFKEKDAVEWKDGLRLYADHITDEKGFRGSIVHLKSDTEYDIKLIYSDPDGLTGEKLLSARTWSEKFPVSRTIAVKSGNQMLKPLSGKEGGYILYDGGAGKATLDVKNAIFCADLENASYIILRNLKLTGSDRHAINIKKAHHIVIEDCEIFEWGRPGEFCQTEGNQRRDGAVYIETSRQIVVQNNDIHDPRGNSCDWRTAHPQGPRGVYMNDTVDHSVIRYNRISGSEKHYYDDLITGDTDGSGSDLDIYGNIISHAWDDGIEIEGKNKNIRVWGNVITNVFQGIASDNNMHVYYGPVYIWRNIFTDLYASPAKPGEKSTGNGFKLENTAGLGAMYIFNNTFLNVDGHVKPNGGISNGPQYNITVLNNIFDIQKDNFHSNLVRSGSLFDYNAYSGSDSLSVDKGFEKSGLFKKVFTYTKTDVWNYYPSERSPVIDKGVKINNFADTFTGSAPDFGAVERGSWEMKVGPQKK